MRYIEREPLVQMRSQERSLRRFLYVTIVFLVAAVGICAYHFKTYSPAKSFAEAHAKRVKVRDSKPLKIVYVKEKKTAPPVKREVAAEQVKPEEIALSSEEPSGYAAIEDANPSASATEQSE